MSNEKVEGATTGKLNDILLKFWTTGNRMLSGKSLVKFAMGQRSRLKQNECPECTPEKGITK